MRTRSRWGAIVLGLSISAAGAELLARQLSFARTEYDPDVGRVNAPGERFVQRYEGNGSGVWQAKGVRRAAPLSTDGQETVLIIGDSYAEAVQVTDRELVSTRLEALLAADVPRVQVALVGKSGLSVADYVLMGPEYRNLLHPAWVVIQVRGDDFGEDAWSAEKPHFVRTRGGRLVVAGERPAADPAAHSLEWWGRRVLWHSAAARLFAVRAREFGEGAEREPPLFRAGRRPAVQPSRESKEYPVEEELELLKGAWGGRLTLLYLPDFDLRYPERKEPEELLLERAARTQGIDFVNLRDSFGDFARRGLAPYGFENTRFGFGHWNADAHEAAAALLAREIGRLRSRGLF